MLRKRILNTLNFNTDDDDDDDKLLQFSATQRVEHIKKIKQLNTASNLFFLKVLSLLGFVLFLFKVFLAYEQFEHPFELPPHAAFEETFPNTLLLFQELTCAFEFLLCSLSTVFLHRACQENSTGHSKQRSSISINRGISLLFLVSSLLSSLIQCIHVASVYLEQFTFTGFFYLCGCNLFIAFLYLYCDHLISSSSKTIDSVFFLTSSFLQTV